MRLKSLTYILSASLSLSLISCGGGDHDSEELATNDSTKVDSTKYKVETFANAGLTSQYLWRGALLDSKPNIQPIVGLTYGGFELGAIGSVSFLTNYTETDVYASYKFKCFKLTATDFFIDVSSGATDNLAKTYFDYSATYVKDSLGSITGVSPQTSGHHVLCDLSFIGTEKIPLKFTISTVLHSGWDLDNNGNKKYTTYFEMRYPCKSWEVYVGGISGQSDFYINKLKGFNIVNVGTSYSYNIKINDNYNIPAIAQLCINPQLEKIYFTFGVTF
jgi:hypothetical protein